MNKKVSKDEALKAVKTITKEISESSLEQEALEAVKTLILWAGDDPEREGLVDTPKRVVKAYKEFFSGYEEDPEEILTTVRETLIEAINIPEINKENILSIGITNQRESIVFWNKKTLLPLSPAISWQCLRGIELCKNIKGSKLESII